MEQRRGRESVTFDFFVDICKNLVTNSLVDTGWTFGTGLDIGTGWIFSTDLDIDTDLFIGTDWIFGTDLVIGSGFIVFVELIIVDSGSREAVHHRHRREGNQPLGEHCRRKPEVAHRPGQDSSVDG